MYFIFLYSVSKHGHQTEETILLKLRHVVVSLHRLQELVEGELKDMEHFFTIFPTAFSDFDSDSYKTSVVGKDGGPLPRCFAALIRV